MRNESTDYSVRKRKICKISDITVKASTKKIKFVYFFYIFFKISIKALENVSEFQLVIPCSLSGSGQMSNKTICIVTTGFLARRQISLEKLRLGEPFVKNGRIN